MCMMCTGYVVFFKISFLTKPLKATCVPPSPPKNESFLQWHHYRIFIPLCHLWGQISPGSTRGRKLCLGPHVSRPVGTSRHGPSKDNDGNGLAQEGDGATPELLMAWAWSRRSCSIFPRPTSSNARDSLERKRRVFLGITEVRSLLARR
jgi:hypothetical protein